MQVQGCSSFRQIYPPGHQQLRVVLEVNSPGEGHSVCGGDGFDFWIRYTSILHVLDFKYIFSGQIPWHAGLNCPGRISNPFLFPPVSHMSSDDSCGLLGAILPSDSLHEISLGIHQVEINAVIHEIVLARLHALRGREVHAVCLAHILDLLPGAREPDEVGVEFGEVGAQHGGCVAGRVAGYEDGQQRRSTTRDSGAHDVDGASHLVKLFGADIWAVGEAEIYLLALALA